MARLKGSNVLVDPAAKKKFIEMRDHFEKLDEQAKKFAGKRRQYQQEIKLAGFSMGQIKDSLLLSTPEGEAEFKAEIANRLLAAAYSDADIGDQLSLFLDGNRTPAVDRAFKEGQTACMSNKAANPKYAPDTDQYRAYMDGFHAEQERMTKAGIKKLEKPAEKEKAAKPVKAAKPAAKGAKPRGRPPGKKAAAPVAETRLIKKADKDAAAAARAPKADAPPRRPTATPVTRATVGQQKAVAREEAESYFTKSTEPAGNA